MKKCIFSFAMIVITMVSFGQVRTAPPCTLEKYPDLYTGDGGFYSKPDELRKVTMTVPFTNVKPSNAGVYYYITHPVEGNECVEVTDLVPDSDMEGLKRTFTALSKEKDKSEVIKKMDISISLTYINGKTDGVWRVSSIGHPKNFYVEKY